MISFISVLGIIYLLTFVQGYMLDRMMNDSGDREKRSNHS